MASSLSVDIATTLLSLTCRRRSNQALDSRLHATVLPFLPFKTQTRHWSLSVRPERSFNSLRFSNNPASTLRRRFCSATTTSTSLSEDSDLATKIPPDNRIPATIITGFLGSGKTTLLNHILTAEHGKRIAVIENEFGEVDIDGSLVAAKTTGAEDIVMLNNGCLCCTVRGDLVRMISELVERKRGKFDHIVIETTGLANPSPIIQTFYAEDSIFNDVKLDGVVTLVDAKHATFHLDEVKPKGVVNEAVEQIAYADRVIVNKTDLVGEQDIASLVQRIRNINRMAHLKRTQYGKVDLDYVLGIGGFDLERIESAVGADAEKGDHGHGHGHDHDHVHDRDHNHEHGHHHDHDHQHEKDWSAVGADAKKEDDGHDHDHDHDHELDHYHDHHNQHSISSRRLRGLMVQMPDAKKEDHGHDHDPVHDHDHDHELDHRHDHDHQHEHHHSHDHTHDPGVSSVSIVCEGNLDLEKANMWLGTLLYERSEDIYRMKGLLSVQGMDERFVFQGVHDIFQGSPDRLWGLDEPRINKMVFIGKNLDQKEIEKGFRACLL